MDFRIKSTLQNIFSILPNSEGFNYLAQKHLTGNMPPSKEHYKEIYDLTMLHHNVCKKYVSETSPVAYEIGCGWDLLMALIFSTLGYREIVALDTVKHARIELINTVIGYLKEDGYLTDDIAELDKKDDIKQRLQQDYSIKYMAPCDSANTGLCDNSVDFIYSHMVFEHIPANILPDVMAECRRVLKNNGVISLIIDYGDHYRTFDKSITPYNLLKYTDKQWRKYNPEIHYVNRLRHKDFLEIFRQTGFEVLGETVFRHENHEEILRDFPLAEEFKHKYTTHELSITHAYIVLRPR